MSRPSDLTRAALLPLGALAAGFAFAQTPPKTAADEAATVLPTVKLKAAAEPSGKESLQATTTTIGKGKQELRDIPQSVTVMTERLMDDRNLDTLKAALHNAAGITFQAAEGGEEDVRVRGFSLAATGDLYIDGMRDPALYDRDTFNLDRVEVLRGSASMLFGRGSTGGVVNQVSKQPRLLNETEVALTAGSEGYLRGTLDHNQVTGENAALRLNAMHTQADNGGAKVERQGVAGAFRWGIGTADEFSVALLAQRSDGVPNYGIGWLNGTIVKAIPANAYYGMASDYMKNDALMLNLSHLHRFEDGGELKTQLRTGRFSRDFWASTIRFTSGGSPAPTTVDDSTTLYRGNQGRAHVYNTTYLQSDYSRSFQALGWKHSLLAGADLAIEGADRDSYSSNPTKPTTTVGTPNDGASITDTRVKAWARSFDSSAVGVYAQDMVEFTPEWKLVGGLRYDHFKGRNDVAATATAAAATYERADDMLSKRLGLMYQPNALWSFHASYGTSFNTSGDTYSYDALGSNTPPEKSRNFELGAKLDLLDGALSTRAAIFHSEKYNERNRDPDTAATQYLLSGKRHAQGMELDFAGRLTPQWELFASYAYIWQARIDKSATASEVGTDPGLTPEHSGSIWTTYRVLPALRLGLGVNGRSKQSPVGNAAVTAPAYMTTDLMAEYTFSERVTAKLNVNNVTDELYADQLYRGHYVPGAARNVQLTITSKF